MTCEYSKSKTFRQGNCHGTPFEPENTKPIKNRNQIIMTTVKFNGRPVRTFDNLFEEFFNLPTTWNTQKTSAFPAVNITETKDADTVELNLPGGSKEHFKVNIDNGLLTISYERTEENKAEDVKHLRKEFTFESFKRSFSIDEKIDAENIQAKYENGILKFVLPKKEEKKNEPKQINIQ